jgi:hypothetical protein
MKTFLASIALFAAVSASAQSESMMTLRNKFRGQPNVVYVSANGLIAKTVLLMTGERDFKRSIQHVRNLKLVTVPKVEFEKANVTVNGFRKVLASDSFVQLATVRDHGDDVFVYLKEGNKPKHNRYFILIDDDHEVIGIEIRGYIDPNEFSRQTASARHKI